MSKNNNVNPGQYKLAGRERQGESLDQNRDKSVMAKSREQHPANRRAKKKR